MGNNFVKIKKSEIEGSGVFAIKDFKKSEKVYSFKKGNVVNKSQIQNVSQKDKRYLDKISDDEFEIIEPPARYVNHSCNPNITEKERTAYALKNIKKGEEITIDYDKIAYLEKPFECHCGSKNCRKFVRGRRQRYAL